MPECPQEAFVKLVGEHHNAWATYASYIGFCFVATLKHPPAVEYWIIVLRSSQIHALTCMWSPTWLMMAQPLHYEFLSGDKM